MVLVRRILELKNNNNKSIDDLLLNVETVVKSTAMSILGLDNFTDYKLDFKHSNYFCLEIEQNLVESISNNLKSESLIESPSVTSFLSKKYIEKRVVDVNGVLIGENDVLISGPCAIESREQIIESAVVAKQLGVDILRGGAFKPRTNPYSFSGLGADGLKFLQEAKNKTGLPIITEIMHLKDLDLFSKYDVDIYQIGARNCQNYNLLIDVASHVKGTDKSILLKKGASVSINEYAQALEYLYAYGVDNIIACFRGSTRNGDDRMDEFGLDTRNGIDIHLMEEFIEKYNVPVIYDVSHSGGKRELVNKLGESAINSGANGLMIEAHPNPDCALCDGKQSLYLDLDKSNEYSLSHNFNRKLS